MRRTFVEEDHDLLEGLHEVNVVVAVLLDLDQEADLRLALGGEGLKQGAVLLWERGEHVCLIMGGFCYFFFMFTKKMQIILFNIEMVVIQSIVFSSLKTIISTLTLFVTEKRLHFPLEKNTKC